MLHCGSCCRLESLLKKLLGIILITLSGSAFAESACPAFYPDGKQIAVPHSIELCNSFYVVEFDTTLNAPIISAERFRESTAHIERSNDFHPDTRLDVSTRAERSDYAHSGFDQGHLTPAGDATTAEEMHDSFLLSNMTPQWPTLNRQSWRLMEMEVRKLKPDYVVTGAIYSDHLSTIGAHQVPVPSGYWKIIVTGDMERAWYADNIEHAPTVETTVHDIETRSGLMLH